MFFIAIIIIFLISISSCSSRLYRNTVDIMFCSYICNIVILIHWFWQFFGTSSSFLHRWVCHLWIKKDYFSFHIWWHFLSFSCLITLAKTSSTMLDRNDECRHLCLIVSFRWKVFTLTTKHIADCRFFLLIYH